MARRYAVGVIIAALAVFGVGRIRSLRAGQSSDAKQATVPRSGPGATTTRLPDGRLLVAGGQGTESNAWLVDPQTGTSTPTANQLEAPRAWHTATLLADGTVLIIGGRSANGVVDLPEIFDPGTDLFSPFPIVGAVPRAEHTATLLLDGRVLVAGGSTDGVVALPTETWDPATHSAIGVPSATVARQGHTATLMADGRVLLEGGSQLNGQTATGSVAIDPIRGGVQPSDLSRTAAAPPTVSATIPAANATDVPIDTHIGLRFSEPLTENSLNSRTITLAGPNGPVPTRLIAAEGGRLAFVWPADQFASGSTYTLAVSGAMNSSGVAIVPFSVAFTTMHDATQADAVDSEDWTPDTRGGRDAWKMNRPPSPWENLPPLMAAPGVTAVSGRVLRLNGQPLPNVTIEMEGRKTFTDRTGRFLLEANGVAVGEHTLGIDGSTATHGDQQYGFYEARISTKTGITNVLPFTIWSPKLDTAHAIAIPSPTASETVVTTPTMPGLELHLPAGTVIYDENWNVVQKLTMTPIPLDRTPFPLPTNATFTMFFTIQPGGAYIQTPGPVNGGWLVYPNTTTFRSGTKVQFFNYDPDDKGWFVYGLGTVTPTQIVPEPKTRIYAFTGASFNSGSSEPPAAPPVPPPPPGGDPIDPATGIFLMEKTDLYVPDVMPLTLTRTYNSMDPYQRAFGTGMTHSYGLFQYTSNAYNTGDLVLPNGIIHYVRISADGLPWYQTVFECDVTPSQFYKSRLSFDGNAWEYALKDGTVYIMGHMAPLQAIRDRYGNEIRLTWSQTNTFGAGYGNLLRVTSPSGRWIAFTYDANNRVIQASDNIGRTVSYTYDGNGNLSTVTDPENNVTTYTWDTSSRLLTITNGRNIAALTNHYDASGRVDHQTLADPNASYAFGYTTDQNGNITQTDITDPLGNVKRLAFNADHYVVSETQALGSPVERTTSTERQAGTDFTTATTDGLGRRTEYTYDVYGHVLTTTRLAGTPDAATTTFTYEPTFFQLATATDPLNHTWTFTYDPSGHLTGAIDPLTHQTTIELTPAGQVTSVTDPLSHTWQFGYTDGVLTSTTNPLNALATRFVDAAGRVIAATDPLGRQTRTAFDHLNRVTSVTDPTGNQTAFTYDADSNLLSMADALTHTTNYTYDSFDRVGTRVDPLTHADAYQYDFNGKLTQATDRKNQVTARTYDALKRLTQVTYADTSTVIYTYDAGDRVTAISDSANGAITRTYDGFDRVISESTSEGSVTYTYDTDGRRSTMTVAGQPQVSYTYDDAHRLTSITEETAVVSLTYDNADRRSTLTYPNGVIASYGYDAANELTSLTYTLGGTTLGDLQYTYDLAGHRTTIGGLWARTGLPTALASATYDAANRILTWAGTSFSYDPNGNLTSDGVTSYSWNARNQLIGLAGGASASFAYDGIGRRRGETIGSTTTNFLYDARNFVQELSSGGVPTANLLTGLGLDEIFTRTDASGTSVLLTDASRSTLALADGSGTVQTQYTFEPFGATTTSGAASTNPTQFTGRENDGTGLYFYRARYYSAQLQRFASEDPIGFLGGYNVYRYAEDNPVSFVDPLGLDSCEWFGLGGSIGFGIAGQYFVEIGRCTDDCGNVKWKKRQCLCTGLGAGATVGPLLERGNDSPMGQGWSFSTPLGGMSGSPDPSGINFGPGAGAFYWKCICDDRDSIF